MNNSDIKIYGIIPSKKIPEFLYSLPHNKISQTYKLSLSNDRPGIINIISLHIKINIKSYKKFFTSSSCKININAVRHIDFTYNSLDNSVHTATYDIPFSMPIILNNSNINVKNVLANVLKLSINKITSKSFCLTSTVFAVALTRNIITPQKNTKKIIEKIDNKLVPMQRNSLDIKHNTKPNRSDFWDSCLLLLLVLIFLNSSKPNFFYK